MPASHHRPDRAEFDVLYRDLAQTWLSHQALKVSDAPLAELADSNHELFRKRMALGSWDQRLRR